MRPLPLLVLALLLGTLPLLPLATAGGHENEADRATLLVPATPPPLDPGVVERVPLEARVPCAWLPATLRFQAPEVQDAARASWVHANLAPEAMTLPAERCRPGDTHALAPATLEAAMTEDALAFTPLALRVRATLDDAEGRAHDLLADLSLEAAYVGRIEATVEEPVMTGKPQDTVTFLVRLVNHGNHHTRVHFDARDNHGNLGVIIPASVILGPAQGGQGAAPNETLVPISVQTPYRNGHVDERSRFTLRAAGSYALDPGMQGAPATLDLEVHTVGAYVPAPPGPLLLALLGLAAASLPRRR